MHAVLTLALKDLRLLWRDKFGLFWVIAFPLLMALFFGSIFSSQGSSARNMKIAYVAAPGEGADAFHDALVSSAALEVTRLPLDSARSQVTHGDLVAYVHYVDSASDNYNFFTGRQPSIEVGIDPARKAEAGYLQGLVTQAWFQQMKSAMSSAMDWRSSIDKQLAVLDTSALADSKETRTYRNFLLSLDTLMALAQTADSGANDSAAMVDDPYSPFQEPDIKFTEVVREQVGPRSSWEITFPQALQWSLIGCAAAFALSIVTERTRGTLLRLRLAPISRAHVLAGKGLACFIACVSVTLLLLLFGVIVFDVNVLSWPLLLLAIASAGICFVGIMMLISVMGKTEQAVGGAGWAILLVFSMTGGGMIPLMVMPSWMVSISHFSPVKWSVLALEGAIWRGFTIGDMLTPVAVLVGVGAVGFAIGVTVLVRSSD